MPLFVVQLWMGAIWIRLWLCSSREHSSIRLTCVGWGICLLFFSTSPLADWSVLYGQLYTEAVQRQYINVEIFPSVYDSMKCTLSVYTKLLCNHMTAIQNSKGTRGLLKFHVIIVNQCACIVCFYMCFKYCSCMKLFIFCFVFCFFSRRLLPFWTPHHPRVKHSWKIHWVLC